jgi:cytochrome c-type biogenesis protein
MADGLNPLLAFAAGALTILSPCVLPLVPVVLGSAVQRNRFGPLALSAGLVLSFTVVGLAVAALGASSEFDADWTRRLGAALLMLAGLYLLLPMAQTWIAQRIAPLTDWAGNRQQQLERYGLVGQAAIGMLLGLVWSPCVGPTLGAATILASQGQNLREAALVMLSFGLGIAAILLLLAIATRGFLQRRRGRLMYLGHWGKQLLGGLLLLVGAMIITGVDRRFEAFVVAISPDWLNDLTTRL